MVEVIVTATSIEARDGEGAPVASFDYFQPTVDVIQGLAVVFGSAPVSTPCGAGNHNPSVVEHWKLFLQKVLPVLTRSGYRDEGGLLRGRRGDAQCT